MRAFPPSSRCPSTGEGGVCADLSCWDVSVLETGSGEIPAFSCTSSALTWGYRDWCYHCHREDLVRLSPAKQARGNTNLRLHQRPSVTFCMVTPAPSSRLCSWDSHSPLPSAVLQQQCQGWLGAAETPLGALCEQECAQAVALEALVSVMISGPSLGNLEPWLLLTTGFEAWPGVFLWAGFAVSLQASPKG